MPNGPQAIDFPDPFVFRANGSNIWYAYATGAGIVDLQSIASHDLVNWGWNGDPLPGGENAWADLFSFSWAPSVIERPGNSPDKRFVMYYTAHDRSTNLQCIGRATSSSPAGGFADERTSPLMCQPAGSIDPSPYVAADGSLWLTFANVAYSTVPTSIWTVRLTPDGLSLASSLRQLLAGPQTWEGSLIEAPTMISSPSGRSSSTTRPIPSTPSSYSVGVARCTHPAGPVHPHLHDGRARDAGHDGGPRRSDPLPRRVRQLASGVPLLDLARTSGIPQEESEPCASCR